MKKKKFSFLKLILGILVVFLLLCAGGVFYIYQKVNDIGKYKDELSYDYQSKMAENEGKTFEDFIFYDKEAMVFEYKVPAYFLYEIINEESMAEILALPEELEIADVGVKLMFEEKEADIYLSLKYRNLINTCLLIKTDMRLKEDQSAVQLLYRDLFVIDEEVSEYVRQNVLMEKGTLLFEHKFPVHVPYYRMPDYRPAFIHDLDFDKEYIYAKYDIASAMKEYLAQTEYNEDSFEECMEKVYLEVRMNGIAH